MKDNYRIEVIASGTCFDRVGKGNYKIDTYVFRGNQDVVNEFMDTRIRAESWEFDEHQNYLNYMDAQIRARSEWEKDIKEMLGWNKDTGSITHNVSEFFTAVFIERVE